ncbi:MAG TPA: SO_0444 family Cu/Zn efflux transporter [Alphaproteobacteria bacterium]|nr:SO_0444 family Cu/Zn efflux transporter [Alphaproteobacteria bacterium]HIJ92974.1 SO_0444 family Cu/Zn efflux transporter [Rhodospirillaceae bacterium]HJM48315.1 SO_0444 family Cu/Zn efflux transporter [Alphaproteobacteria bacterium]
MELLGNILGLYLEAAPWLLFGLVMAGVIKAWMPETGVQRWMAGEGLGATAGAALLGAPLPICSCGVLPAAIGLRRAGASRQATVSFMISTPETGIDSVAVSYALLGPFMAVARPVAAVASALMTGLAVGLVKEAPDRAKPAAAAAAATEAETASGCADACCGEAVAAPPAASGLAGKLRKVADGVRYALTDILDDFVLWLGIGLVIAGIVTTYVPGQALAEWGSGPLAMGVMLLAGIPMYICATASTPLAASLLLAGVSPGAAMVFLLAGPATNVATLAVVRNEMGTRTMVMYLVGICLTSVAAGLVVDGLVAGLNVDMAAEMVETEFVPQWLALTSGVVLALLVSRRLFSRIGPALLGRTA